MVSQNLNAGQIYPLALDYLLVPEEKLHEIIAAAQKAVTRMYQRFSTIRNTPRLSTSAITSASMATSPKPRSAAKSDPYQSCAAKFQRAAGHAENPAHADPGTGGRPAHDGGGIIRAAAPISHVPATLKRRSPTLIASRDPLAAYYFGEDKQGRSGVDPAAPRPAGLHQRCHHAGRAGRPALRRRRSQRHGRLPRLQGFQTFSHAKSICQASLNVAKLGGMLPPLWQGHGEHDKNAAEKITPQLLCHTQGAFILVWPRLV